MKMKWPLSTQINHLVQGMNKAADRYIQERSDLTFSRFQLLATLLYIGESTQHGLAQRMGVSDTIISRIVHELSAQGYLEIRKDPNHGRRHILGITEHGTQTVQRLGEILERSFMEIVSSEAEDPEQFERDINNILKYLQKNGVIR